MSLLRSIYKKKIFVVIALLILTFGVFLAPKAYSYYQAQKLEREADILVAQEKYEPALDKYKLSKEKWNDVKINEKITKTEKLLETETDFVEKDKVAPGEKKSDIISNEEVKGVQTSAGTSVVEPTLTPIPTNALFPTTPPVVLSTSVPTQAQDDTQKLNAIKNLFQKIIPPNKTIIYANFRIQSLMSELDKCQAKREELIQLQSGGVPLGATIIDNIVASCSNQILDFIKSYSNTKSAAYQEISNINRQIQDIIATCGTSTCNEVYQGVVSELEAQGYVAR